MNKNKVRVLGTFWGPWDIGMTETYFKSIVTSETYATATRAYFGSPYVKSYPLIRAIGKMHRSLQGVTMSGKHTSKYAAHYKLMKQYLGNPKRYKFDGNFAWGIPDDFIPSIPYFELFIPIPDGKQVITMYDVYKFVEKMTSNG